MTIFLGVDPGRRGAIVMSIGNLYEVVDMDYFMNIAGYLSLIDRFYCTEPLIVLEKFVPYCGERGSAMSAFTMGKHYGLLLGALQSRFKHVLEVQASTWMRKLFAKGEKNIDKNLSMEMAQKVCPSIEYFTPRGRRLDGRADAVCLTQYGKVTFESKGMKAWE